MGTILMPLLGHYPLNSHPVQAAYAGGLRVITRGPETYSPYSAVLEIE
jgi:hypothetical protein